MRQAELVAQVPLFLHRAPQRGIPGMDPGHHQAVVAGPLVERADPLQRQLGRVDHLGARPGVVEHVGVDQAGRPDHHVRLADDPGGAQREQVGRPGPGPDEPDLGPAPGRCGSGHSFPPRVVRRAGTSSVDR